jgi:hypothetical protein
MRTVNRMISMPKRRVPISNEVGSDGRETLSAISPMAVSAPVFTTSIRALPLMTEVPMNTALVASCRSVAVSGSTPGRFSTG